jgi:hypothetical protein
MATPSVPESAPLSPAAHLPDLYTIESPELRATVCARTPIRFTEAGEPYLPLPTPYENFYLSPMRQSDLPGDMAMMVRRRLCFFSTFFFSRESFDLI